MKTFNILKNRNNSSTMLLLVSLSLTLLLLLYINIHNNDVLAFSIASAGDWGCNSDTDETVDKILSEKTDMTLGLGDYSYEPSADCWLEKVEPLYQDNSGNMKISIGNHENDTKEDLDKYLSSFGMAKQYYSFTTKNVHFLVMATEIPYKFGSEQYKFVANDLSKASADKNVDWTVVIFHRIMYTSPTSCTSCDGLSDLIEAYHPIFDKYGVDLVLQGHAHDYQRTFPLQYNKEDPSEPTVISKNPSKYTDPNGPIFAIIGTGGEAIHAIKSKSPFIASQHDKRFGHLAIDISKDGTTKILKGKFIANDGKIMDEFEILNRT